MMPLSNINNSAFSTPLRTLISLTLLLLSSSIATVSAQQQYGFSDTSGLGISYSGTLNQDNTATLIIAVPSTVAWAGLGFGSSMTGSPMIVAWITPQNSIIVSSRDGTGRRSPPPSSDQSLGIASSSINSDGSWSVTITRSADGLSSDPASYIWAASTWSKLRSAFRSIVCTRT
ncbi:hypothetical protein BC829DRAFT_382382 [Chytridium lagenaria]|nr:hypothetical protein BC829DRAFT_382382 [Chytridium lagenaria]